MAAPSLHRFFAAWRVEAPFSAVSRFDGFWIIIQLGKIVLVIVVAHAPSMWPSLLSSVASLQLIFFGAGNSVSEGYWPHMFHDILVWRCHWLVNPCGRSDPSGHPFLLVLSAANNKNEVLFPLLNILAGDRVFFTHNRRSYNVLQGGMDVAPSFLKACDVLHGTAGASLDLFFTRRRNREFKLKYLKRLFDANNILCLQEVHGTDEFLQAIQVLAPRFRLFGIFSW